MIRQQTGVGPPSRVHPARDPGGPVHRAPLGSRSSASNKRRPVWQSPKYRPAALQGSGAGSGILQVSKQNLKPDQNSEHREGPEKTRGGKEAAHSFVFKHLFHPFLWNVIVSDESRRRRTRTGLDVHQKAQTKPRVTFLRPRCCSAAVLNALLYHRYHRS